jgi:RNA polymerase sigma factor (sigma-70 family)
MNDDAALLRLYAEQNSESAFRELVRRHADLVYGAALRRTRGDVHLAADVSQQVFTKLVREARKLSGHTMLPAWLHTATRNAALNLILSEQRRKTRETEMMNAGMITPETEPDWEQLKPLLDGAIDELSEADRGAVVLRFLEKRPFAEIGLALGVSEDAARMRTERALDKLRAGLSRRGITSTVAALGLVVMAQPIVAAPTGLALTLATEALAAGGIGFFATLMTTKIITTIVLSALVAFGAGNYVGSKQSAAVPVAAVATAPDLSGQVAALEQTNQQLTEEIAGLQADVGRLTAANQALSIEPTVAATAPAKSPNIGGQLYELQQAIMNNLRQIDFARTQYQKTNGHVASSIEALVGTTPQSYIKTVRTVGGESYYGLSMMPGQPMTVVTPDGVSVTFDPHDVLTTKIDYPPEALKMQRMQELGRKVQPSAMKALEVYRVAHDGANPPNEEAMLPYFATPEEGADYVEFMEARKATLGK